jgi:hypothetical protein
MVPVMDAGGPNPVTADPGHTPTFPLTVVTVPGTLVTVELARIPKVHAVPRPETGGNAHTAEVVNVHT